MGKLDGHVAFITGAARGQGRSHAVRLAEDGADIIGIDICDQIPSVKYAMATPEDLKDTVRLVEALGRSMIGLTADVRDSSQLRAAYEEGSKQLGTPDIVLANAGIMGLSGDEDPAESEQCWKDAIDVMLTGVWNTLRITTPPMIDAGNGGSIVITSSAGGIKAYCTGDGGSDGYAAAKFGVIGLMKGWANTVGKHSIRVNSVHPTGVMTPMIMNDVLPGFFTKYPDIAQLMVNGLPVAAIEAQDVSNAIAWLVSDDARYVTGVVLPVDAGSTIR